MWKDKVAVCINVVGCQVWRGVGRQSGWGAGGPGSETVNQEHLILDVQVVKATQPDIPISMKVHEAAFLYAL